MNKRERIILIAVATVIVGGVVYGMLSALLLGPRAAYLESINTRTAALAELTDQEQRRADASCRLASLVEETYTGAYDNSSATLNAVSPRLRALVAQSGLNERTLTFVPAKPGPLDKKGKFRQISWALTVQGKLAQVTDFLYLLSRQPYLHRIENLKVRPDLASGEVNLSFSYRTLALLPKGKGKGASTTARAMTQPALPPALIELDTPDRRLYDAIASRDLFRPYMKRVVTRPPPTRTDRPDPPVKPRVAPSTDGFFRVVGLSNWSGDAQAVTVLVTDTRSKSTVEHCLGSSFGGGTIVWVDYRPMPDPKHADLLSLSRVIIKIKDQYWAIELGQTLAEKRVLEADQLPRGLADGLAQAAISPQPAQPTRHLAHLQLLAQMRVSELTTAATTGTLAVGAR